MASAINFNTVWTSIFEPLPTFGFLDRLGKESVVGRPPRPAVPRGRLRRLGRRASASARPCATGSRATGSRIHCNHVDDQDPSAHDDSMLAANQRIWGFETNFGGLADLTVVKANQLMPKPTHLTWEEAACNALCNSTSYRMIVSPHAGDLKQGDAVLIWGATGGIGGYAVQYVLNGGGTPVGVVSSRQARRLLNEMGCEHVIDRKEAGYQFWKDEHTQDEKEWRRLGKDIRGLIGRDVDIVFEHPGRQTFGASVFVAARGGKIVTCAATSRLHDRVRQPPPLDEAEEHRQLALRQLQGGVGGQPAHLPRARSSRCSVAGLLARGDRRGRPRRPQEPDRGQGSACCAWPPRRASASTTPSSASKVGEDKITLFQRFDAARTDAATDAWRAWASRHGNPQRGRRRADEHDRASRPRTHR